MRRAIAPRPAVVKLLDGWHTERVTLTLAELRSLALHRAVADKLSHDAALLALARTNLDAAAARGTTHPHYVEAWRRLLALPLDALLVKLVDESQEMRDLRQASPFAGVLTARERWKILDATR